MQAETTTQAESHDISTPLTIVTDLLNKCLSPESGEKSPDILKHVETYLREQLECSQPESESTSREMPQMHDTAPEKDPKTRTSSAKKTNCTSAQKSDSNAVKTDASCATKKKQVTLTGEVFKPSKTKSKKGKRKNSSSPGTISGKKGRHVSPTITDYETAESTQNSANDTQASDTDN
jgi:hypothetical protein